MRLTALRLRTTHVVVVLFPEIRESLCSNGSRIKLGVGQRTPAVHLDGQTAVSAHIGYTVQFIITAAMHQIQWMPIARNASDTDRERHKQKYSYHYFVKCSHLRPHSDHVKHALSITRTYLGVSLRRL
jgi:hypothetical protein